MYTDIHFVKVYGTNLNSSVYTCERDGPICVCFILHQYKENASVSFTAKYSRVENRLHVTLQVNNAAVVHYTDTKDTKMADFDHVIRTNLRSPFFLTKLCIPHLVKSKGKLNFIWTWSVGAVV